MKFTLVTAVSSLALVSELALGQIITQSEPFKLITLSSNTTYNNVALGACHEGAGIEALCSGGSDNTVYHVNTTKGTTSPLKGYTTPATLVYAGPGSTIPDSEAMTFYADPATNVGLPLFEPGATQTFVSFDSNNLMVVQATYDDTVSPPNADKTYAISRWYVCTTNYEGYTYNTLSWVYGNGKPENPSCVKVDVKREFC